MKEGGQITGSGPSGAGARRFAFRPLVHRSNPGSPPTGGAEGSKDGKSSGDRSSLQSGSTELACSAANR